MTIQSQSFLWQSERECTEPWDKERENGRAADFHIFQRQGLKSCLYEVLIKTTLQSQLPCAHKTHNLVLQFKWRTSCKDVKALSRDYGEKCWLSEWSILIRHIQTRAKWSWVLYIKLWVQTYKCVSYRQLSVSLWSKNRIYWWL